MLPPQKFQKAASSFSPVPTVGPLTRFRPCRCNRRLSGVPESPEMFAA